MSPLFFSTSWQSHRNCSKTAPKLPWNHLREVPIGSHGNRFIWLFDLFYYSKQCTLSVFHWSLQSICSQIAPKLLWLNQWERHDGGVFHWSLQNCSGLALNDFHWSFRSNRTQLPFSTVHSRTALKSLLTILSGHFGAIALNLLGNCSNETAVFHWSALELHRVPFRLIFHFCNGLVVRLKRINLNKTVERERNGLNSKQ